MNKSTFDSLRQVNQIIAVGSVDGVLTTAALLRVIAGRQSNSHIGVFFTQAFEVAKIDPTKWQPSRIVAFVDLAVNNKDKAMTADFVQRIRAAGHSIIAVIDEHSREDWLEALGGSFDGLVVEPVSQAEGKFRSSGALLCSTLGNKCNHHVKKLLAAADAGDRTDFTTHFGGLVNQAVKSAIADNSRREKLARHFAKHTKPDQQIMGWVAEYEEILRTHAELLASKQDFGNGIYRIDGTGKKIDVTTFMASLYKAGAKVVVLVGSVFDPTIKAQAVKVSFGTDDKNLDLLSAFKEAGIGSAYGFAQKANVDPADEAQALEAVRQLLTK